MENDDPITESAPAQPPTADDPAAPTDMIPILDVEEIPAPAALKRTVEQWATAKGMLPQFVDGKKPPTAPAKAAAPLVVNPAFAAYAAAKASLHWPIGMELTEAEFDKAIALQDGPPVDGVTAHIYR